MWSAARVHLGLASEEFWRLAPRQYVALLRQKTQVYVRQEFGPAVVAASFWNAMYNPKKPIDPTVFMPSLSGAKDAKERKSVDHMMAIARNVTMAMGGKVGAPSS